MSDLGKLRQTIDEIDREMARLFEQRMDTVSRVAEYKAKENCPVEDSAREQEMIERNRVLIQNEAYRPHYTHFLQSVMTESKAYQRQQLAANALMVRTSQGEYPVHILQGGLHRAGELFHLDRKVMVVTDSGVPEEYVMAVASQCDQAVVFSFRQGETSKNMDTYTALLDALSTNGFCRTDCVVAVGGGVVGDLAGFAAATYMRGVDFYNIPTTLLAQVDASIGGKTAINQCGYKNTVGVFYPPKGVLIDLNTLDTLSGRQVANGMAEVIKMAVTCDAELFALLENSDAVTEEIVQRALRIKKQIVEQDEHECGLRKVLNFGHTLGHAYESISKNLLHGECVAMGMVPLCHPAIVRRVEALLLKWGLASEHCGDTDAVMDAIHHDKKVTGNAITLVTALEIGQYEMRSILLEDFEKWYRGRRYYEEYIWESRRDNPVR